MKNFLFSSWIINLALPATTYAVVMLSLWMSFCYAPPEVIMGEVQRIFYVHVGAATASYVAIFSMLIGGVGYLKTRSSIWADIGDAARVTALLFSSLVLVTGMIWGKAAWNTFWNWEPRLTTFFMLWMTIVASSLLKYFSSDTLRNERIQAVLGIASAIQIPLVIFSVKIASLIGSLHPQVAANQGLRDVRYIETLMVSIVALVLLSVWYFVLSIRKNLLQREALEIAHE